MSFLHFLQKCAFSTFASQVQTLSIALGCALKITNIWWVVNNILSLLFFSSSDRQGSVSVYYCVKSLNHMKPTYTASVVLIRTLLWPCRPNIPGHQNMFFSWYTVCSYATSCLHYCAILELQSENFHLEKIWETRLCFVCFLPCQTARSICPLQNRPKNSLSPKISRGLTWIYIKFAAWSFSVPCNTLTLN